jgi:hypothetical protein
MRSIEGVILGLRALEKVKLYKARHLVEMTRRTFDDSQIAKLTIVPDCDKAPRKTLG